MSDSISGGVSDQVKDLGIEAKKSAVETISPKNIFKSVLDQLKGSPKQETPEDLEKQKKAETLAQKRIREIDEEIRRIAEERKKLTGPEIPGSKNESNTNEDLMQNTGQPKPNLQVTLAQTKGETGRGAKG